MRWQCVCHLTRTCPQLLHVHLQWTKNLNAAIIFSFVFSFFNYNMTIIKVTVKKLEKIDQCILVLCNQFFFVRGNFDPNLAWRESKQIIMWLSLYTPLKMTNQNLVRTINFLKIRFENLSKLTSSSWPLVHNKDGDSPIISLSLS